MKLSEGAVKYHLHAARTHARPSWSTRHDERRRQPRVRAHRRRAAPPTRWRGRRPQVTPTRRSRRSHRGFVGPATATACWLPAARRLRSRSSPWSERSPRPAAPAETACACRPRAPPARIGRSRRRPLQRPLRRRRRSRPELRSPTKPSPTAPAPSASAPQAPTTKTYSSAGGSVTVQRRERRALARLDRSRVRVLRGTDGHRARLGSRCASRTRRARSGGSGSTSWMASRRPRSPSTGPDQTSGRCRACLLHPTKETPVNDRSPQSGASRLRYFVPLAVLVIALAGAATAFASGTLESNDSGPTARATSPNEELCRRPPSTSLPDTTEDRGRRHPDDHRRPRTRCAPKIRRSSTSPTATTQTFAAGAAGSVTIARNGSALSVVSVDANAGWVPRSSRDRGRDRGAVRERHHADRLQRRARRRRGEDSSPCPQ